jgi:hypothetical protein
MPFTGLDIPDNNAELAGWLESQLVGLGLADVVAGWQAFRPVSERAPGLDEVLGDARPAVLVRGLSALAPAQLKTLLQHPRLLLPLQELVLVEGGAHWQEHAHTPEHLRVASQTWEHVQRSIAPAASIASSGGGIAARRSSWAKMLTAAAVLLVGFFGWWQLQVRQPAPTGWGWDRPGALATNVSAADYLDQLAGGASDWFQQRPEDAAALRTRLVQFQHGCDTLLSAPHAPLAAADKDWLLERCRAWRGKIDEHIAALDGGSAVQEVRDAADATVNKLVAALRERAAAVG